MNDIAAAHPDKQLQLWFQDECRVGNKGRVCYRWWLQGQDAPGTCQQGYKWAYIYTAVEPATGNDFTLVLPRVTADAMQAFLDRFAAKLDDHVQAVLVLDGAGWHDRRALRIPHNISLVTLPPYSPELNPVERIWLHLRDKHLSFRVFHSTKAIVDACCHAWNALTPHRLHSLCAYPWIMKVIS